MVASRLTSCGRTPPHSRDLAPARTRRVRPESHMFSARTAPRSGISIGWIVYRIAAIGSYLSDQDLCAPHTGPQPPIEVQEKCRSRI